MTRIAIAKGDGIGPEIVEATLSILRASGAEIQMDYVDIGEKVYLNGNSSGIDAAAWEIIRKNKIFLKGPVTTPQGGGYKSINVSTRKFLGLYANVRPCVSHYPFIETKHPEMNVVIVRENEEDLYAGIEHQQTDEVIQCLKLISRPGCEKIVRYAFEYALQNNKKKVTCFTKDNIMKQTDGMFRQVFNEIGNEYPDIEKEHWIVDIGAAKLADTPECFEAIVMQNLYGDILSDVAAQITGSVGLGGSANIGESCAMFEAIHGSAPTIAGQDVANPSGLIHGAIMMLNHIGQAPAAEKIHNAWLKTIEDGVHTQDIYKPGKSSILVGTKAFASAVINNLGLKPSILQPVSYTGSSALKLPKYVRKPQKTKELKGIDLFFHWTGNSPDALAAKLKTIETAGIELSMITNRGIKVWPGGFPETFCTDHWRCRFMPARDTFIDQRKIIGLFLTATLAGLEVIKSENLYAFDGVDAFSLGQGQ
ncbi:isocitrate dehydrogenase [Pedobacter suwonensis]|uniref:Isocitrate dehydrogenase [NADP] n=1 Tax=Pedobacter suwonensis TaxID=332999 RepID=A0A1I0SMU4_9SPHI|nr:NADP-dependent isocitrate dehydrogenase [Pedobacter suwonensis]SFA40830.1 isocitrate dehydrogenase [Pedobacter suwonensis]